MQPTRSGKAAYAATLVGVACVVAVMVLSVGETNSIRESEEPLGLKPMWERPPSPRSTLHAQEERSHLERLEAKLADHERKLSEEKAGLARKKRALARRIREEKDSMQQYHRKVENEHGKVQQLKHRIGTLHWAEQQRAALEGARPKPSGQRTTMTKSGLNHDDIMPPPDANLIPGSNMLEEGTSDSAEDRRIDASIAATFTHSFEEAGAEEEEAPITTLMQLTRDSATGLESKIRARTTAAARAAALKAAKLKLSPAATAKMVRAAADAESTHAAKKYKQRFAAVARPKVAATAAKEAIPPKVAKELQAEKRQVAHAQASAHKAELSAAQAKAEKKRYLHALMAAHGKLAAFSKTVADGNKLMGAKYEEKLKAEALKFQRELRDEKAITANKVRKEMAAEETQERDRFQAHLQALVTQKAKLLKANAAKAVRAAKLAAAHEKAHALQEAAKARHAKAFSQKVAKAATERSEALKAAAAAQLATMASQKAKAVGDFKRYTHKLKSITSEEKAKEEEKLLRGKHQVGVYLQEAASAARVAEAKATEADMQASHASISQVRAARTELATAIHEVSTVDTRARGRAAIIAEHDALIVEAKRRKKAALEAIHEAKEGVEKQKIRKAHAKKAEVSAKAHAKAAARLKKQRAYEKKLTAEAYAKGRAESKAVYRKQLAAMKVKAVEREAKDLLRTHAPKATPALPPPLQAAPASAEDNYAQLAKQLVDQAVKETASGTEGTKAAVEEAIHGLETHEKAIVAQGAVDAAVQQTAAGQKTQVAATAGAIEGLRAHDRDALKKMYVTQAVADTAAGKSTGKQATAAAVAGLRKAGR